ncbi:MAG: hypothetical protein QM767_30310 [Anaeromyxobacter sp.]
MVPAASVAPYLVARAGGPPPPASAPAGWSGPDAAPAPTPAEACREQRAAYLEVLWQTSGIELRNPDLLIEGLEGSDQGAGLGFYWFALATDPFRPLAWSSDLRDRAEALARCVRAAHAARR